jgi:A/G-specific adenine glycosylase
MPSVFAKQLLKWHSANPRPLPWDNGPRDPYHIWISEIIMQQTRIEQGAPYYLKFISGFPDVATLAKAHEDEVLKYWQGLGYYSRARNLHKAAQQIVKEFNGGFPSSYDSLLTLPGIGPYSAAAISSFAFNLPYPVVDGNVKRVVARYAGIQESIDDPKTHDLIREIAAKHMKGVPPGEFNQAIMNFGALVCKPKNPLCHSCGQSNLCVAFNQQSVDIIPVRSKKKTNQLRYFHFYILQWKGKWLLMRREQNDIWKGLYTPPLIERSGKNKPGPRETNAFIRQTVGHDEFEIIKTTQPQQQLLSHQTITGRFYLLNLLSAPKRMLSPFVWIHPNHLHDYGKPKMVNEVLQILNLPH